MSDSMGLARLVRRWVGPGPSATVVLECRRCGTSVTQGDESCPSCGAAAISRYEIR